MSYVRNINIKITGQVSGGGNNFEVVLAKFQLICAEYNLKLEDNEYEENLT